MKKSKIKSLSVLAASLVAIFTVICLVGFSACDIFTSSSSSSSSDDDDYDHVHIVTSWDLEEATCEEDGSQLGTCDICGDAVMLVIPATGHDYVYEVIAEASCEEDGLQTGVCSKCGNEVTEEIPATGHDYVFETTKEATCEEEGSRTGVCSVCGDTVIGTIPATGHSWDDGTVTKEATEDEEGEIVYTCTVCGETKTETIPKVGVAEEDPDEGDDEDDGDDGQNEPAPDYSYVTDVDGDYSRVAGSADESLAGLNVGKLGSVEFGDSSVNATLGEDGKTWTLSGMAGTMSEEQSEAFWVDETIAADHVGHKYIVFGVFAGLGETVTVTSSTNTETTWEIEGATEENVVVRKWIVDVEDLDDSWYMLATVSNDNGDTLYEYTIVLGDIQSYCELNGHTWVDGDVKEATCMEGGYTAQTCSVCGVTQKANESAALGHDYVEVWDWSAESSGEGYNVTVSFVDVCSRCGDEKVSNTSATDITSNEDGTYTAKVQVSDSEEYEDTTRVFVDADDSEDGAIVDIGMGTEYTPQKSGNEITSYVFTKVSDNTTNLVVAGYVNGLSVSVGLGGSGNAVCSRTTLEAVVFEEGVTSIASYAFYYCTSLKTVTFCDTITEIGDYAFQNCSALFETLEFGKSLTKIGTNAFFGCTAIESIKLNDGLVEIGKCAFQKTDGLSGCLEIPSSVTTIVDNAFYQNNGCAVTSIVIHGNKESGTTIGENVFFKYTKATTLVFDGGTFTSIGSSAFQTCNYITTLIISNGATFENVHSKAFNISSVIETVYFDGTTDDWNSVKTFLNGYSTLITDECLVYYYSETEPEESDDSDTLYWHWGEDGKPEIWDV